MREMAASRASLSFLDTSRDDLRTPDSGSQMSPRMQLYKSYDSLDVSFHKLKWNAGYKLVEIVP